MNLRDLSESNAQIMDSLKRSLQCKSVLSDVEDSISRSNQRNSRINQSSPSGCSRPLSNLRDGEHANKRPKEKQPCRSPISFRSDELPNAMAHEANTSNSKSKMKSNGCCGNICGEGDSTIAGTVNPRTLGFGGNDLVAQDSKAVHNFSNRSGNSLFSSCGDNLISSELRRFQELDPCISSALICRKCGERFSQTAASEAHRLSKHAVSELVEGNTSRRIVEIICRTTSLQTENNHIHIETVLKVCNMQEKILMFEEYREIVKTKARQLGTRHTRCRADGNELLRFFGTTILCSLGVNGSSAICSTQKCGVCQILRRGFSENEFNGGIGIFTTSSGERALDYIKFEGNENRQNCRKALLVCRAIAGRIHKPLVTFEESLRGFDSLAGKVGQNSIVEDLYLLNPNGILACFVVICS